MAQYLIPGDGVFDDADGGLEVTLPGGGGVFNEAEAAGGTTHATSGTLSAGSAAVAGAATHNALHATSGALASSSASIAGTAARSGSATEHATSGALTAGSATVAGTAVRNALHATSGTLSASAATVSGTASRSTPGSGTITTPPLKNNTGTLLASISGWTVNVYNASTGDFVVQKTGLTTGADGVLTVSDALIVAATSYSYEPVHATYGRRLPTAVAA